MRELKRIIVHHSATPNETSAAAIRGIHVDVNGWDDVGYHFLVERDGTVVRGRDLDVVGAHALGHNADSIGVCLIGNNDDASNEPHHRNTPAQFAALAELVRCLLVLFGPLGVVRHSDVDPERKPVDPAVEIDDLAANALYAGPSVRRW